MKPENKALLRDIGQGAAAGIVGGAVSVAFGGIGVLGGVANYCLASAGEGGPSRKLRRIFIGAAAGLTVILAEQRLSTPAEKSETIPPQPAVTAVAAAPKIN